jgi:hypothetical protein
LSFNRALCTCDCVLNQGSNGARAAWRSRLLLQARRVSRLSAESNNKRVRERRMRTCAFRRSALHPRRYGVVARRSIAAINVDDDIRSRHLRAVHEVVRWIAVSRQGHLERDLRPANRAEEHRRRTSMAVWLRAALATSVRRWVFRCPHSGATRQGGASVRLRCLRPCLE